MATKHPTKKGASKTSRKSASSQGGTATKPVKKVRKRSSSAPSNGAKKKTTSKRTSSAPRKATKKRASTAPKKRASRAPKKRASTTPKKRRSSTPASSAGAQPTTPARPRAKKATSLEAAAEPLYRVSPRVPPPPTPPPEPQRVASYLESLPQDRAELVAGLFQVARGAAKDLRTLFTQAIALSHQKNDRFGR